MIENRVAVQPCQLNLRGMISHRSLGSLALRLAALAAIVFLIVLLVIPFARGLYESLRKKTYRNQFGDPRLIDLFRIGWGELWGTYSAKNIETLPAREIRGLHLDKMTPYQLTVLASRADIFDHLTRAQRRYLNRSPYLHGRDFSHPTYIPAAAHPTHSFGQWQVVVRKDHLEQDPVGILRSLNRCSWESHPNSIGVTFLNADGTRQEGVDIGGLSREFLSTLCMNLKKVSSSESHGLLKFQEGLPLAAPSKWSHYYFLEPEKVQELNNQQMSEVVSISQCPNIYIDVKEGYEYLRGFLSPLAPDERQAYKNLGTLLSIAFHQAIPIGPLFHDSFYKALIGFSYNELMSDFEKLSSQTLLRVYCLLKEDDPHIKKMIDLVDAKVNDLKDQGEWTDQLFFWAYPDEEPPEHHANLTKLEENFDLYQQAVETQLCYQAKNSRVLPAIHAIGSALDRETFYRFVASRSTLVVDIQGQISRDYVISKIQCSDPIQKNFMIRWLREEPLEQISRFVKAVTGAETLASTTSSIRLDIVFAFTERHFCVFHTCTARMDLPPYTTYPTFKAQLNESITLALRSGFLLC